MSDELKYCVVCDSTQDKGTITLYELEKDEGACVCESCHGLVSRLELLVTEWNEVARGGCSQSGRTAFKTAADELYQMLYHE